MKIYCILLDTMPFCETAIKLENIVGGKLRRQVSACYTTATLIQLLTGELTSDVIYHGLGYLSRCDNWPWLSDTLPYYLNEHGFDFKTRNHSEIVSILGYNKCAFHKDDTDVMYMKDQAFVECLGGGSIANNYKNNEIAYIRKIQQSKENSFYIINYNHCHAAPHYENERQNWKLQRAYDRIIEILNSWDFNEPDSMFYVFSDHGLWHNPELTKHPLPTHFFTFNIFRDNTKSPVDFNDGITSSQDFYNLMLNKFNDVPLPIEENRIYFTEDGRSAIDSKNMTSAIAITFTDRLMKYVIYHSKDNKFVEIHAVLGKNKFVTNTHMLSMVQDIRLVSALKNKFDWVK